MGGFSPGLSCTFDEVAWHHWAEVMDRTGAGRILRWASVRFGLVSAAFLVLSYVAAPAGAAPSPAASPCQPWGDETTEGADLWAEVARKAPTFAGVYVDEEKRTVYVLLTDDGQSLSAALHALQTIVRSSELCEYTPVARPAKHSYLQLKEWDDQLVNVLSLEGTVSSGIDEVANRLEVGVEDLEKQGPLVEAMIAEQGIPREGVSIVQQKPVELLQETRSAAPLLAATATGVVIAVGLSATLITRRKKKRSQRAGTRSQSQHKDAEG